MSRSDSRRSARRTPAPLRVASERVSPDELVEPSDPATAWADPAVPRVRPARTRTPVTADEGWGPAPASWHPPAPVPARPGPTTGPVRVPGDDHPSGPLPLGGAPAGGARPGLPVLAPRPPIRRRLAMLLRLVIRSRRGGRHRSDAPHLQAWSMFAPHRRHPRRGRGAA